MTQAPQAIRLDVAANVLEITWRDGRVDHYEGPWLRSICPCAGCRGHAGEREPPRPEQVAGVRVTHVEAVGTYALSLTLTDGHATGIYTWRHLRENAPPSGRRR